MKTEDVNKTFITTYTPSDKDCCHCSISANHQPSLSKPWNSTNRESETTWIPLCLSIHAGLILPHQANITFSATKTSLTIHLDIIQEES